MDWLSLLCEFLLGSVGTWYLCNLSDWGLHTLSHIHTRLPLLQTLHSVHMAHHKESYPVGKLLKDPPYSGQKGEFVFAPLVFCIWFLCYLCLPLRFALLVVIESTLFSYVSNYLHQHYHLKGSWLEKYKWFQDRRNRHYYHHHHLRKNMSLGGLDPVFDKLFGTYNHSKDKKWM
mmetsp:Transcript_39207/g.77082  ORF Transcript_39207/g.77082 Transcript_39207/m.77082 type:complete len:174 (-) Transcript_39207:119-640(-)|eukprot:CAMPEP_0175141106 /NCGR_PEP_ID=MMETSP0087-20121206/11904_1 /TAXON_ID=136419 /ORGANISM="Unknown Unknown, Strain D1" /LENGTH=173 /DNA_ID=CAMNT_0016424451 /DNA_START=1 /DNA_END=522 /DNA_ORIENTATION=-